MLNTHETWRVKVATRPQLDAGQAATPPVEEAAKAAREAERAAAREAHAAFLAKQAAVNPQEAREIARARRAAK